MCQVMPATLAEVQDNKAAGNVPGNAGNPGRGAAHPASAAHRAVPARQARRLAQGLPSDDQVSDNKIKGLDDIRVIIDYLFVMSDQVTDLRVNNVHGQILQTKLLVDNFLRTNKTHPPRGQLIDN